MTENELKNHQILTATEIAKGKVVTPCVKIDKRQERALICPFLDMKNGCSIGFVKNSSEAVSCPEGNGKIIISNEPLHELINNIETVITYTSYAQEISQMEASVSEDAKSSDMLFI